MAGPEIAVEEVLVGEAAVGNIAILKCHSNPSARESAGWSESLAIVSDVEHPLPAFEQEC